MCKDLVLVLVLGSSMSTKLDVGENTNGSRCSKRHLPKSASLHVPCTFSLTHCLQEEKEAEFERLKQEAETAADSKTAKNRAKRQKKKEARGKLKASSDKTGPDGESQAPFKKRRLVDGGKELLFRKPGEESDEDDEDNGPIPAADLTTLAVLSATAPPDVPTPQVVETARIVIHED